MSFKSIITALLLIFICVGVLWMARKPSKTEIPVEQKTPQEQAAQPEPESEKEPLAKESVDLPDNCLVVYYFHGNARCSTCIKFEEYTNRTMTEEFPDQLEDNSIKWIVLNIDDPENEQYRDLYRLYTKAVIVSERVNGQETRWKDLKDIWSRVGDEADFRNYIKSEVEAWLAGGESGA